MKKVVLIIAIVLIAGVVALIFAGKTNAPSSTGSGSTNQSTSPSASSQSSQSQNQQSSTAVSIKSFAFTPDSLTVKKGTTVTWTNEDSAQHSVIADGSNASAGPSSGLLAQGKIYSFTFNTVGTFTYHCGVHPSMKGTVTVTE